MRGWCFAVCVTAALGWFGTDPLPASAGALFVIKGGGWGNGVGMGQWGAEGYALHGWDYRRILAHYYPQTSLGVEPGQPLVRVLLAKRQDKIAIGSASPFLLVDARGFAVHVRSASLVLTARLRLGRHALTPPVQVQPGAQPLTLGGSGYRGGFVLDRSGQTLSVVNVVSLERYLRGVVPSEMPRGWQFQAYEAQAVAARSYAVSLLDPGAPFDLYADNRSQVYGGIAAESQATNAAVGATAGQVLTYEDRVIRAYYDSSSGGRTAAVQDVFPGLAPRAYLVSVRDPYDSISPYHRWSTAVNAEDLSQRLKMAIEDVRVEHAPSGTATRVLLIGQHGEKAVASVAFAQTLDLRSYRFAVCVASLRASYAKLPRGRPLHVRGFLRDLSGVVLQQRLANGSWRQAAHVRARPDGRFDVVVHPTSSTAYRLAVDGIAGPEITVTVVRRSRA